MKQGKKSKGIRIQWKIFIMVSLVALLILLILWSCQVLFLHSFYQYAKTQELKQATLDVIDNLENDNLNSVFDDIVVQKDINIKIINTKDFEDIYSGGNGYISATHDIGIFEILDLYDSAIENGGEVSRYYTYDREKERLMKTSFTVPSIGNDMFLDKEHIEDGKSNISSAREKGKIGIDFFKRKPNLFTHNNRYVDDFLYAKVIKLDNGTEYMIISDIRVTPLESTINILKSQLLFTSIIAVLLSLILSYIISRHIAKPIEKLNSSALELARGNFNTKFSATGYKEIEQLNDTLNFTAKELGKVERFRQELLANVSHDLRTPLTMIGGYAEVMRDIPGENTPENIQVIIDETKRLTSFVNNILDLSKLQSGIEVLNLKPVNLSLLLENICTRYDNLTKADGIIIEREFDKDVYILCDESKITQAFQNLLDNAINHTGQDKKVKVLQKQQGSAIRLEISDSGKGIEPNDLPHIWDRYYRADKIHSRAIIGSGIGLSIVKSIFELHKLKYGVESVIDKGTTFWVEFKSPDSEKISSIKSKKIQIFKNRKENLI